MSWPPDHHKKLRDQYGGFKPMRGPAPPPIFTGFGGRKSGGGVSGLCYVIAFIMGYVAFMLYGEGRDTWSDAALVALIAGFLGMIL